MNFACARPHPVPRALSLSQEQVETVKTPTPEPQETETRKVRPLDSSDIVLQEFNIPDFFGGFEVKFGKHVSKNSIY